MRKIILILIVGTILTSCASMNAKREFAKDANRYSWQILPEYKNYINRDPNIEHDLKMIKKQIADEFQDYIDKGMK